ncbi:hypothetical protein GCM10009754_35940 [Amycolatopsis minnesotensis]|uniref:Uncharacterized protein n=2 Tax=Amycolatopsis minnesotensis TaxID=337894 RepID=A0ABP5CCC9_9PSEU
MSWPDRPHAITEPLAPVAHRFVVNLVEPPTSSAAPSSARPFILRGLKARKITLVPSADHTAKGPTLIQRNCNEDGHLIDDSYTVPDT